MAGRFGRRTETNNTGESIFDPGAEDRREAQAMQEAALAEWEGLRDFAPSLESMRMEFGEDGDIRPYDVGAKLEPEQMERLSRLKAREMGLQDDSAMLGKHSAFGAPGFESEFGGLESAYGDLGPSAFGDLDFDSGRMGEAENYFGELMHSGTDAIAEADYARRTGDAERARRSHTDAALADLEMRGQGSMGGQLLAELSGSQGMASDMYEAGLDASAVAQARRDSAAGSLADISERRGRGQLDADTARALGLDDYSQMTAAGLDAFGIERAAGADRFAVDAATGRDAFTVDQAGALDDWANKRYEDFYGVEEFNAGARGDANAANFERANMIGDANTDMRNNASYWNRFGAPQQQFQNQATIAAGKTGQYNNASGTNMQAASGVLQPGQLIFSTADNIVKSAKGGK